MSSKVLYVFMHGKPLGTFHRSSSGSISFAYEPSYTGTPLSLSLPLGHAARDEAAEHYLENLLPEDPETQERLASLLDVPNDTFGLLSKLGEDVAGAAVISSDESLPSRPAPVPVEASTDQIAYWIASLTRDSTSPPPDGVKPRFSLAGQQGKFSLAQAGSSWLWSTAELPSTHIFKPAHYEHPHLAGVESASLRLAEDIGIPATESQVMEFHSQEVFLARRWDRINGERIHAEDLLQAYGDPWTDKYGLYADDARKLVAKHGLERAHLRQLLFNVAIGNADAHAKNYSLLLDGDEVELAPLYDAIPIFLYPRYNQDLCIALPGGKRRLTQGVNESDWVQWATDNGYDPGLVLDEMRDIFGQVSERLPEYVAGAGVPKDWVDSTHEYIQHVRRSLPRQNHRRTQHPFPQQQDRHPKGTPIGGQFAEKDKGGSGGVGLGGSDT